MHSPVLFVYNIKCISSLLIKQRRVLFRQIRTMLNKMKTIMQANEIWNAKYFKLETNCVHVKVSKRRKISHFDVNLNRFIGFPKDFILKFFKSQNDCFPIMHISSPYFHTWFGCFNIQFMHISSIKFRISSRWHVERRSISQKRGKKRDFLNLLLHCVRDWINLATSDTRN